MSNTRTTNAKKTSHTGEKHYFNVYSRGLAYLNGVRITSKSANESRTYVQLAALQGSADNVEYVYYDLLVSKQALIDVINQHRAAIEDDSTKVLVQFTLSNPRPNPFLYEKGQRTGELGATMSGFLNRLSTMKVEGELVYEDTQASDQSESVNQAEHESVA